MPSNSTIQQDALAYAITDIIWKGGNGQKATLCLPNANVVHVPGSPDFNEDGLTEKVSKKINENENQHKISFFVAVGEILRVQLQLCELNKFEELHQTIRRNIHVVNRRSISIQRTLYIYLNDESRFYFIDPHSSRRIPVRL